MPVDPLNPPFNFLRHADELGRRAAGWMQLAVPAREAPSATALTAGSNTRSFQQLHANANRLADTLHQHGLRPGDALALLCRNRVEFVEVLLAALRSGLRLTPIHSQLTADEVRYIVQDSGARLLIAEAGLAAPGAATSGVAEVLIGDDHHRPDDYLEWLQRGRPDDPIETAATESGTLMLYTSGTTGRPKGVFRRTPELVAPQFGGSFADYRLGDVVLCVGPAYHSAPLLFDIRWPLASGVPIVLLEQWDTLTVLKLIQQHRISHMHMVPTMFQRLLAVPAEVRMQFDVSSLRVVLHGAAPCSVPLKRQMIDWLGPVLTEYYAATEGGDGIHINSADWSNKPGSVGRVDPAMGHRLLDDAGRDVAPGAVGRIYFKAPAVGRFEYFGDPGKTASAYDGDRFTLGDLGYVDADGYLFLTGRAADCIIAGGVNIYPREVDEVLLRHPAVHDVCTVGVPDAEWGERVVSVVVPARGQAAGVALRGELLAHAAASLAAFKRPRDIVFDTSLPHTATGKLQRNLVRLRFWQGQEHAI